MHGVDTRRDSWCGYRPQMKGATRYEWSLPLYCWSTDHDVCSDSTGGPRTSMPWSARRIVPGIPPDPYQIRDGKRPDPHQ